MTFRMHTLLTAVFISTLSLQAIDFDKGGTCMDFQKLSDQRFKNTKKSKDKELGANLVVDGDFENPNMETKNAPEHWKHGAWTGLPEAKNKLKEITTGDIVKLSENNHAAHINHSQAIDKLFANNSLRIKSAWNYRYEDPEKAGGSYQLKFRYRAKYTGKTGGRLILVVRYKDNSSNNIFACKDTGKHLYIPLKTSGEKWNWHSRELTVPHGTSYICIHIRIEGVGDSFIDDVELRKIYNKQQVSVMLIGMGVLDNTFCLMQNSPGILTFTWKRNVPVNDFHVKFPILNIKLPSEVKLISVRDGLSISGKEQLQENGKNYTLYKINIRPELHRIIKKEGYEGWRYISAMLTTDAEPGLTLPNGCYWVSDKNKIVSTKQNFSIRIIPKTSTSKTPQKFLSGVCFGGPALRYFNDKQASEKYAKLLADTGFTWIMTSPPKAISAIYRKHGIKYITPSTYYVADGYRIGTPKNKPEYAKFKALGKGHNIDVATCPLAIYTKSDYFKNNVVPYLEEKLLQTDADGIWTNWEPYKYIGQGCFCERCRDEFANYAKVNPETLKNEWPKELLPGGKHHKKGIKFRSWQHAKLVKTLNKAINQLLEKHGKPNHLGFIPGVQWNTMTKSANGKQFCQEHNPWEYAANLRYIDPWGPYVWWQAESPFAYTKGENLITFIGAKEINKELNKRFPNPAKRPKLVAYPHGQQLLTWITSPEAIAMDQISFFLNGFEASTIYYFPRGYDARYWHEITKANEQIAFNEDIVFEGKKFNSLKVTPVTPYPAARAKLLPKEFPNLPPVNLLQVVGYKHNHKLLAAVGNFWEKGDTFFKLKINGLKPDKQYIISQTVKRFYFGQSKEAPFFTGAELEKGILLHVGALRWAFYVIEPAPAIIKGRLITQKDIHSGITKHLPELTKAAQCEEELEKLDKASANKRSDLKKLTNGNLSCQPIEQGDTQLLKFASGQNSLILDITNGMVIKKWLINNKDAVSANENFGICRPMFWQPSLANLNPCYVVTKQEKLPNGSIKVIAQHQFRRKQAPELEGLLVTAILTVSENCKSISVSVNLKNNTPGDAFSTFNLGFRFHNLPACLTTTDTKVLLTNDTGTIEFKRNYSQNLFAMKSSPEKAHIAKLFKVKKPVTITTPTVQWKQPHTTINVSLEPIAKFAGYACWDSPKQTSSSFEAFYNKITLPPGKAQTFTITMQAE